MTDGEQERDGTFPGRAFFQMWAAVERLHRGEDFIYLSVRLLAAGPRIAALIYRDLTLIRAHADAPGFVLRTFESPEAMMVAYEAKPFWVHTKAVDKAEYDALITAAAQARAADPRHPLANPHKAVDFNHLPPLY